MTRKEAAQLSAKARRLPEDIISRMWDYRKKGYGYRRIAYIMEENPMTVWRYCKEAGL